MKRALSILWVGWYFALVMQPLHLRECAVHDVPYAVASTQHSLSELSSLDRSKTEDERTAQSPKKAQHQAHERLRTGTNTQNQEEQPAACCSCLGQCLGSAHSSLPSRVSLEWFAAVTNNDRRAPADVSIVPVSFEFAHPFANGPPA